MLGKIIHTYEQRINLDKYWKRRIQVQNLSSGGWLKRLQIAWIRRQEAKFCSTTGVGMGTIDDPCCVFACPPKLYHGLSGIVIAKNVEFKGNVTIYQNVTIAEEDKSRITVIGENVVIGAGAVILNNAKIGDNCRIGAGSVVTKDFPENAIVAGVPAKIIKMLN